MKIKEWFKSLNLEKINSIYVILIVVILTALTMTFWNNVLINNWELILEIFIPILFIYFLSYLILYLIYKKKDNNATTK